MFSNPIDHSYTFNAQYGSLPDRRSKIFSVVFCVPRRSRSSVIAFHVYVQILALPSAFNGIRANVPFSVQHVDRVPDFLSQHSLSCFVTQHRRREFHVDLEHSLRRFGRRTRGINRWFSRVRGGSPETFCAACIEFRNFLREPQSRITADFTHFELSAGTPVFALLLSSDWVGQYGTKLG